MIRFSHKFNNSALFRFIGFYQISMSSALSCILFILFFSMKPVYGSQTETESAAGEALSFAYYLFLEGEYYRSITECLRCSYLSEKSGSLDLTASSLYLEACCYYRGGLWRRSYKKSAALKGKGVDELNCCAGVLQGFSLIRIGDNTGALSMFQDYLEQKRCPRFKNRINFELGWLFLNEGRMEKAQKSFGKIESGSLLADSAAGLTAELKSAGSLPRKSPGIAGLSAALLPGAGHVYAGRIRDGITAFLLNGLFIWTAVEAFDNDQVALGAVLSAFEAGWYAGNIYSAVSAAKRKNERKTDEFIDKMKNRYYTPEELDDLYFSFYFIDECLPDEAAEIIETGVK